jgi:hypothetical protein
VPVRFPSDEQARRHGTFHGKPTSEQLHRFFEPGPTERADIDRRASPPPGAGAFVLPQQYVRCWTPLTTATIDNGGPQIVAGVHRLGTLSKHTSNHSAGSVLRIHLSNQSQRRWNPAILPCSPHLRHT